MSSVNQYEKLDHSPLGSPVQRLRILYIASLLVCNTFDIQLRLISKYVCDTIFKSNRLHALVCNGGLNLKGVKVMPEVLFDIAEKSDWNCMELVMQQFDDAYKTPAFSDS